MTSSLPPATQASGRWDTNYMPLALVLLMFFFSGVAGLVFEILWFQRCELVFGNTIWATSIVLSSFMGGLALGNALLVLRAHRAKDFLRLYATLEVIVGLSGLALTYTLPSLSYVLTPLTRPFADVAWAVNFVRLAIAFIVLLVPATAMGATLP